MMMVLPGRIIYAYVMEWRCGRWGGGLCRRCVRASAVADLINSQTNRRATSLPLCLLRQKRLRCVVVVGDDDGWSKSYYDSIRVVGACLRGWRSALRALRFAKQHHSYAPVISVSGFHRIALHTNIPIFTTTKPHARVCVSVYMCYENG